MFETAEVGNKISKEDFKIREPKIREALLAEQKRLAASPLSLVILINGVEGAGKGETINRLLSWMDARGIETHAVWSPTDEERDRPDMWRFWRALPARGKIGIFFGSWYTNPIIDRVFEKMDSAEFEVAMRRIADFEEMLCRENTLVLKFWLHLSSKAQARRIKKLKKNPDTKWRITDIAKKFFKKRKKFHRIDEAAISRTSTDYAPWEIIEAEDERYRFITVGERIAAELKKKLDAIDLDVAKQAVKTRIEPIEAPLVNAIAALDQRLKLSDAEYDEKLSKYQAELFELTDKLSSSKHSLILVFEGADAAGKGGAIRRLISAIDARHYRVIAFAAPTDEERAHPYLWRFWRSAPPRGNIAIFDRSWYGRVLVERIEGFCAPEDWKRAYGEIRQFEEQLIEGGAIIVKFWLAITAEEQLQRFQDRKLTPYKQYKLTEEDWRNRDKWSAYEYAACEAVSKTNTDRAPWVLVEANDKNWARIKVLKTVVKELRKFID